MKKKSYRHSDPYLTNRFKKFKGPIDFNKCNIELINDLIRREKEHTEAGRHSFGPIPIYIRHMAKQGNLRDLTVQLRTLTNTWSDHDLDILTNFMSASGAIWQFMQLGMPLLRPNNLLNLNALDEKRRLTILSTEWALHALFKSYYADAYWEYITDKETFSEPNQAILLSNINRDTISLVKATQFSFSKDNTYDVKNMIAHATGGKNPNSYFKYLAEKYYKDGSIREDSERTRNPVAFENSLQ